MKKRRMRRWKIDNGDTKCDLSHLHQSTTLSRVCPYCKRTINYQNGEEDKCKRQTKSAVRCLDCYNSFIEQQKQSSLNNDFPKTLPCPKCNKERLFPSYQSYKFAKNSTNKCICDYAKFGDIKAPFPKYKLCNGCNELILFQTDKAYYNAKVRFKVYGDCKHKPRVIVSEPKPPLSTIEWHNERFVPQIGFVIKCKQCDKDRTFVSKRSFRGYDPYKTLCRECSFEERVLQGKTFKPNFNMESCCLMDELNKEGYNFRHANNGGEVRIGKYFIDGYDVERNIIIEFLDRWHWRTQEARDYHDMRAEWIINKTDAIYLEYDPETEECNRMN